MIGANFPGVAKLVHSKNRGLPFITPLAPLTLRGGNVEINLGKLN